MILNRLLKLSQVKFSQGLSVLVARIRYFSNVRQFRQEVLTLKSLLLMGSSEHRKGRARGRVKDLVYGPAEGSGAVGEELCCSYIPRRSLFFSPSPVFTWPVTVSITS